MLSALTAGDDVNDVQPYGVAFCFLVMTESEITHRNRFGKDP